MSRNLRHRAQVTPTKKANTTKRRNLSFTDTTTSDDDDYDGVDAISDSDDGEEPDVEEVEEQAIIDSEDNEAEDKENDMPTPRPSIEEEEEEEEEDDDDDDDDHNSSWEGFDGQEEFLGEKTEFFEDHIARGHAPDHDTEAILWSHGISEDDAIASTRRVRFDISNDYDGADESSETEEEEQVWPDLFVPQSSLDASFRKAIESNEDECLGASSDGEGSYWDFAGEDAANGANGHLHEDDATSESSAGSSGYETDDGETTEEDLPAAANYVGPGRSVLRRSSSDSASEEEMTISRRTSFRNHKGPFLGTWVRDRTKPFVLMDHNAKKLIMFEAEILPRRWDEDADNSPSDSGNVVSKANLVDETAEQLSPMISNSGNLMMSAMNGTLGGIGNHAYGPPEAFFPFTNIDANGNIIQDSLESYDEEDDVDDEDLWILEDLLDFGSTASVDGDEDETDSAVPSSTPICPSTAASDDQVHPLLAHPHLVGAFRTNQDRHQLLSRNKASRASLAFSSPMNLGPIRGIKDNRLAAANISITPLRKQKPGRMPFPSSPASPLVQQQNKRKASEGQPVRTHKRNRSLV